VYLQAQAISETVPVDPAFAAAQVAEIRVKLLFMAEVVIMFWFGTRAKK